MPCPQSPLGKYVAFVRIPVSFVAAVAAAVLALCGASNLANAFSLGTFSSPVDIRVAPGQPALLYIVEKPGRIVILNNEVRLASTRSHKCKESKVKVKAYKSLMSAFG